ncbi:MAG: tRNA (N6-threonylcarbamoyladenosine(37)-N6)-methyltransferase TrmO [Bacteroidales bacterium]|nr:tRNA (N6-threonylcarbamoyladenosine(37)-N6)-methyltransferase TrmO [Bacteroidales bacterium]
MKEIVPIAHIRSDFPTKFGIPRQSGLAPNVRSTIIFEPAFRQAEALRGLENFSHIWLIWGFSENENAPWSPTVRPPRLGGNVRMGVFATRSTFRPNGLALSSVRLLSVEKTQEYGSVLIVTGADLMDGTPIYDIKPYLTTTDCHPEAMNGFVENTEDYRLHVQIAPALLSGWSREEEENLRDILSQDPRPAYHHDPSRIYGFEYAGCEIKFQVTNHQLVVKQIDKKSEK